MLDLRQGPPVSTEVEELANQRIGFGRLSRGVVDDAQGPAAPIGHEVRRAAEPGRRSQPSTSADHGVGITIVGRHSDVNEACTCLKLSSAFRTAGLGSCTELNLLMCARSWTFRGLKLISLLLSSPVDGLFSTTVRGAVFLVVFFVFFALRDAAGRAPLRFLATTTLLPKSLAESNQRLGFGQGTTGRPIARRSWRKRSSRCRPSRRGSIPSQTTVGSRSPTDCPNNSSAWSLLPNASWM